MTYNISRVAVFWVSAQFLSYLLICFKKHIKKAIHDLNTFLDEHDLIHELRAKKINCNILSNNSDFFSYNSEKKGQNSKI